MVAGYFVAEGFIYPLLAKAIPFFDVVNIGGAVAELLPNGLQGFVAANVALGLWRAVPALEDVEGE